MASEFLKGLIEKQEHEARLIVALNFLESKKIARHIKKTAIKGICEKDLVVKRILQMYGVKGLE